MSAPRRTFVYGPCRIYCDTSEFTIFARTTRRCAGTFTVWDKKARTVRSAHFYEVIAP